MSLIPEMKMRLLVLTLLLAGVAAPALAQSHPAWVRERNAAALQQETARRQAQSYEREARAREARARTQEALRSLSPGELAGGPSAVTPYRPSSITPMPAPARTRTPLPFDADAARMDALMAAALERSNARVRAASRE